MEEKNNIFRQKSLERVTSPEGLDKYIRTTTPSLWLLLASIIVLLCGIIVWATVGKIETASEIGCVVSGGTTTCYMAEADYEKMTEDAFIKINDQKYEIKNVTGPVEQSGSSDSFLIHAANIEDGGWYYVITVKTDLANGSYKCKIVFEEISPISFVTN